MKFISFILIYPLIWCYSMLPFRILYFFSDLIYYLIYYIIGYRKKVVFGNLKLVFPEKSEKEITSIAKKFYRHFIDVFGVEMIKSFTMPKKEMMKRYKGINLELLDQFHDEGKSAIIIGAHYANWEWIFNFNLLIKYDAYAVFKRLKNKYFDKKVRETRGRFNTTLISTKETFAVINKNSETDKVSLFGFISDQTPRLDKAQYWSEFLGVRVPIQIGAEVLAKKHNLALTFYDTRKIKRGYYECTIRLLTSSPNDFKDYELTELYLREVEKQIKNAPEYYLWTHKRFKHMGKE